MLRIIGRVLRMGGGHCNNYLHRLALRILVRKTVLINAVQVRRDGAYEYDISDVVAKAAMMMSIMAKTEVAPALDVPGEPEAGAGRSQKKGNIPQTTHRQWLKSR